MRTEHRGLARLGGVVLATVVAALAAYTAVALTQGTGRGAALVPVMTLVAGLLIVLALRSAEAVVLLALVSRSSLDALSLGPGAPPGSDPAQLLSIGVIALAVLWLLLQRRSGPAAPPTPVGIALVGFLVVAGIGVLISPSPVISALEWSRIASIAAMYFVVARIARDPGARTRVLVAVLLAAVVPLVVAAVQAATGSNLFSAGGFDRVRGTFAHSNPFAAYLVVAMLLGLALLVCARSRWRIPLAIGLVAVGAGLLGTYTRGAWIAALVGAVVVLALVHRRALVALAAGVAAVAVLVPSVRERFADLGSSSGENSLSWRWEYWQSTLELSETSPLSGIGLRQVLALTPQEQQPHNDLVRAFVELGVLGLLSYVVLLAALVVTAVRAVRATRSGSGLDRGLAVGFAGVVAAVLTMSLVANLMSQVVVLWYVYALAAAASALLSPHPTTARPADALPGSAQPADSRTGLPAPAGA